MSGPLSIHASAVAVGAAGLLIIGPSGSGKSGLALLLMTMGARLVADERVDLFRDGDGPPVARAPESLSGLIEARGVGLIRVDAKPSVRLRAVVDLAEVEGERLPQRCEKLLLDYPLRLFHKVESPHFAPALLHYLKSETDET